jgi:predicted NBD/HSP70 family sugar kinase
MQTTEGTAHPGSAGSMLRLIRQGQASSRAQLAEATGLARSTASQRVETLLAHGLIREVGDGRSTGGRPPTVLAFDPAWGVVCAADLGATHGRVAVMDLAGTALAEAAADLDIADGPETVLGWVEETFDGLLAETGRAQDVVGIGIAVPGPVEFATGTLVSPPLMPGWDGLAVSARFQQRYGVPVVVDNDVSAMAFGEHWTCFRDVADLLFVTVSTGIGCGIISGGRLHRGVLGAAGDLGHVPITGHPDALCRCGNLGCVEAVAGGDALAARLRERGLEVLGTRDVVAALRGGSLEAGMVVRQAGRQVGQVLASAVSLLNPAVLVVGGELAMAGEQLLSGIRESVHQRALPLAIRGLRIVRSELGPRVGVVGAAASAIEHVLSPEQIDLLTSDAAPLTA